jgi:RHS repeat-associated protein
MQARRLVRLFLLSAACVLARPAFAGEYVLYYHNDATGSPQAMTDINGNVVWRADYEPFGNLATLTETLPNTHEFIGKERDPETSLHYFGARFYDGGIGRFLSVDPALRLDIPRVALITPQLLNNYGYSANNPYRFVDRDGRFIQLLPLALAIGGAFVTNAFLPSTVNAPSNNQSLFNAQTTGEFTTETAIGATMGYATGKVISRLGKVGNTSEIATNGVNTIARSLDDASTLRGASTEEIQGLIPKEWISSATRKGGGTRYANPDRPGEQVRIMPGNPNDSNPVKQGPYVVISKDGKTSEHIPLRGNQALE